LPFVAGRQKRGFAGRAVAVRRKSSRGGLFGVIFRDDRDSGRSWRAGCRI